MTRPYESLSALPIPGWETTYEGDDAGTGEWTAVRKCRLTAYQVQYGAMPKLTASDADELFILCESQNRHAERLATAENLSLITRQKRERDRERRIAEVRSHRGIPGGDVGSGPGPRLVP